MTRKKFEVVTKSLLKNEINGFNGLEDACIYFKKLPKHLRDKSNIWLGHEVIV